MVNLERQQMKFKQGDRVVKVTGDYSIKGTVVAAFETRKGKERYVVDADVPPGLLHIYGPQNLEFIANVES